MSCALGLVDVSLQFRFTVPQGFSVFSCEQLETALLLKQKVTFDLDGWSKFYFYDTCMSKILSLDLSQGTINVVGYIVKLKQNAILEYIMDHRFYGHPHS